MKTLFRTAFQFILAQKKRNLFIMVGLSLGILLIVAAQILMTSLEEAHEAWVKETYGEYDMSVGYFQSDKFLNESEIEEIESYKQIRDSSHYLYPYFGREDFPEMVLDYPWYVGVKDEPLARFVQYKILPEGVFPKPGEVVISNYYAELHDIKVGDVIPLPFPPLEDRVVKVIAITEEEIVVRNLAVFDLEWLQEATGLEGKATEVLIQLDSLELKEAAVADYYAMNPDFDINTREDIEEVRENVSGLLPIIQGLNVVIFLASAMIIISTMQLSVQEKQKELATLRLVGAGRGQVFLLVLVESLVIGMAATLIGTLLGLIIPLFSLEQIGQFVNVEITNVVYPMENIALFSKIFFGIILIASMIPAYQASRLPPLVAYRQATHVYTGSRKYGISYGLLLLVTLTLSMLSLFIFKHSVLHLVTACAILLSLFLGIPFFVSRFTSLISSLTHHLRLPLEYMLAARNTLRQMKRNVQIAMLFTLGVSIALIGVTMLNMVKEESLQYIRDELPTDISVQVPEEVHGGVSPSLFTTINSVEGAKAFYYTELKFIDTRNLPNPEAGDMIINGEPQTFFTITGIDFQLAEAFESLNVLEGSLSADHLGENGVAINKDIAKERGYKYGDTIQFNEMKEGMVDTDTEWSGEFFVIKAIIGEQPLFRTAPPLLTTPEVMEKQFGVKEYEKIQINVNDGYSAEELLETIKEIVGQPEYASKTFVYDQLSLINETNEQVFQRIFILFTTVSFILVLSIIGLMNSSAGSIRERIQELSMLRAIGCSKRKLFILLLCEGAFLLGVCGLLAIGFATWATYHVSIGLDASEFILSVPMLAIFAFAIPIIGGIAVLSPARWATKQNVIDHIH